MTRGTRSSGNGPLLARVRERDALVAEHAVAGRAALVEVLLRERLHVLVQRAVVDPGVAVRVEHLVPRIDRLVRVEEIAHHEHLEPPTDRLGVPAVKRGGRSPDGYLTVSSSPDSPSGRWRHEAVIRHYARRMAFSDAAGPHAPPARLPDAGAAGWQDRALGRTLADARARDVERMERCVAAARDLANETSSAAFTVAQIAARANVSLKSFYRCFPGKDELLLALLEDDSQHRCARARRAGRRRESALDALHACVTELFALLALPGALGYAGVLVREHRRLSEHYPLELRVALAPLIELLAAHIERATASDDARRDAETMFRILLQGIDDVIVGRAADAARARRVPLEVLLARTGGLMASATRSCATCTAPRAARSTRRRRSCPSPSPARATTRSSPSTITSSSPRTSSKVACPRSSRRGAAGRHARRRPGDLGLRRRLLPAGRAQRGRRPAQGRVEHGAGALRRDARAVATTSKPASPTWISTACTRRCASRR